MRFSFSCLVLLASVQSAGACPVSSQTLVSCSFKGGSKVLTTCLSGNQVSYAFGGRDEEPDLALRRNVRNVGMVPWPGIGGAIWEEFTLKNKGISYTVYYSQERNAGEGAPLTGGVIVERGGEELAHLRCDRGSVESSGYGLPLFEAKERAGQVYSLEAGSWQ
ncbi:hypothetical protein AN476_09060 [Phaeobacter sp. 11ANDIMAR09]|nr:hypothetical protein AN476_09060 [Phaeobacter sp. 11ANDIMAR09]